jgi:hypothetical protein
LEALAVVQRIGEEFDGVSAGSPANNSAGLFTQAIWTYKYYQKISTKLPVVHAAALAACDTIGDGVKDGVIGNPEQCKFDPSVLLCTGADAPDCLTAEQVDAVQKIYEGPVNPKNGRKTGEQYAPGMPRGSELVWNGSQGQAQGASAPWYGMVLQNTLTFDLATFNFDTDVDRALKLTLPYGAQVTNPDISAFRDHGGKLLLWAGWNDPLWSEQNLVNYYESVVDLNARNDALRQWAPRPPGSPLDKTRRFARLFMGPGLATAAGARARTCSTHSGLWCSGSKAESCRRRSWQRNTSTINRRRASRRRAHSVPIPKSRAGLVSAIPNSADKLRLRAKRRGRCSSLMRRASNECFAGRCCGQLNQCDWVGRAVASPCRFARSTGCAATAVDSLAPGSPRGAGVTARRLPCRRHEHPPDD